ncbi:hypothetical protein ACM64Y_10585 [Novispirillum sp. DQ9]|uniref:hypothetical protein n=1 Tax=Novispirillum sp. DQ9 TaxID=3398612 RepID=UPI003C7E526D
MREKILLGTGLAGAVLVAEGMARFGSFVGAVGGADAVVYRGILFAAVFWVGVLGAALLGKAIKPQMKWTAIVFAGFAVILLLVAPMLPVVVQALLGVVMALVGLISIRRPAVDASAAKEVR